MAQDITVVVTGAGGRIAYSLIPLLLTSNIFGSNTIHLKLMDVEAALQKLQGIKMEIEDCNYSTLSKLDITSSVQEAFTDADVVILLGGFPRLPGMERKDLISKNVDIIKEHAIGIDMFSKK